MKIYILALLLLTSCATRKVDISKLEIKKDSLTETTVSVNTLETKNVIDSTNIAKDSTAEETCIEPLDSTKEMVVDGKVYKNVVLRIKKNKVSTLYSNHKNESNIKRTDSVGTTKTSTKEVVIGKTKKIDKKANYWFLFYWLILLLILYLLWRNRQRIFNVL
jgi:hypothetical protein